MLRLIIICALITVAMTKENYFAPSVFLNHGGGPNPVLGEKYNIEIADALRNISNIVKLSELKAIIVVTAHREEDVVTVSSGEKHSLVYDYSNVPPESYKFKYDAAGDPILARRLHEAFTKAGIESKLDDKRGWDHGVFIPMMLINPKADIPIVQVSILKNQNALHHYEYGKVLYQFRSEGIAIFGSGMSYHNMAEFEKANLLIDNVIVNEEFDSFLNEVCTGDKENKKKILLWDQEKGALESHPIGEADHLMPLIVNIGASGKNRGKKIFGSVYKEKFLLSGFMWD